MDILPKVLAYNKIHNRAPDRMEDGGPDGTFLLPMAFPEASLTYPTYGAGHETVAGACVTLLKAFFDAEAPYPSDEVVESSKNGRQLDEVTLPAGTTLTFTVEGELNKLASNLAVGCSMACEHYANDNAKCLLRGEQISIGILQEQKLTYGERFSMSIPLFNGETLTI